MAHAVSGWAAFAEAAPELAAAGLRLLAPTGTGDGFLATVRADAPPRVHPVSVEVVDGRLLVFVIVGSAKDRDLCDDGRYALHAVQDPSAPSEFLVRGRAVEVRDPSIRATAAAAWSFTVDDGYRLFELGVDQALLGERASPDAWPPVYRSWRRAPGG